MKAYISIGLMVATVVAVIGLALLFTGISFASSNTTVTANVNVGNVIYLLVSNAIAGTGNVINFGIIYPGSSYDTNVLVVDTDNGGNIGANVLVAGGNWILSTNSLVTFPVGNTLWSPTALSTATGTALTSTFANTLIPIAAPTINSNAPYNSIYFGLTVPGGTTAGNYIQTISFENYNATQNIYNKSTTYNAITADVQVGSVCYISLSPTSISFGSVVANSNVPTNVLVTDTDTGGNAAATLLVNGTNWFLNGNSLATSFGVSNTLWDSGTQTIYTGNALSNTLVSTGITIAAPSSTTPSTSNSIYFGLGIPGGTPAGVYEQTITLENSC